MTNDVAVSSGPSSGSCSRVSLAMSSMPPMIVGMAIISLASGDATPKRAVTSVFAVRPVVEDELLKSSPLSDDVISTTEELYG